MIDAPFCNAVSLLTGFTGWVLAVWSFLRPERALTVPAVETAPKKENPL